MRCLCSLRWYKQASSERRLVCVRSLNVVCFKKAGGECMQSTPKNMWLCESVNPCTVWGLLVCEQVLAWQCRGKMIRNVVSGSAIFFQVHKKKKKIYPLFLFWLFFLYRGNLCKGGEAREWTVWSKVIMIAKLLFQHFSQSSWIFNYFPLLTCCQFNSSVQFMSTPRLPLPGSVGHSHQNHTCLLTQWTHLVSSFRTLQCIHRQTGALCSGSNRSLLLPRASSQDREAFYGLNIVNIEQFFL